ncbi:MAG: hypothetical protein WB611_04165 [Stellaceae bacterium]
MRQDLKSVTAMLMGSGNTVMARVKPAIAASAFGILTLSCTLPADPAVRAYDACMSRHPHEAALCEGPLQAYQLDMSAYLAAAAVSPPAGASTAEGSATGR